MAQQSLEEQPQVTAELVHRVRSEVSPEDLRNGAGEDGQDIWHQRAAERPSPHERLSLYLAIYDRLLEADGPDWPYKATTLVRISDCFRQIGCFALAKRYCMLALYDEARIAPVTVAQGSYQRLLAVHGLLEVEIQRYAERFRQLAADGSDVRRFPESGLCEVDDDWQVEIPSPIESGMYFATGNYIRYMLGRLSWLAQHDAENLNERGRLLERLANYCLFCMPGAKTRSRVLQRGTATDYDVVCSLDGFNVDFRTELGRYFLAECKAFGAGTRTPFDVVAKFARVLEAVKSKFGIVFCPHGVTGMFRDRNAEAEQLGVYRDSGIVIVALTETNLQHVASGRNLINILRRKYDQVRLLQVITQDATLDAAPRNWVPWTFPAPTPIE